MNKLYFSLFGTLRIQDESGQIIEIEARRAQELLSYLLINRNHMYEREKLATLQWGDKCTAQSKRYLRQTLWQVQSAINQHTPADERLIWGDHERIGINPHATYWLDIAVFDQTFSAVEPIQGKDLTSDQVVLLRDTLPLYRGDLLDGWYQDWCLYERDRYQGMYLALLDKLLDYSETHGEYEAGLGYGEQILRYDRAREQTHRRLMRLHYAAGNRTQAIHQYDACVTALREELDVEPAKSTVTLYKQICIDQVNIPALNRSEDDSSLGFLQPVGLEPSGACTLQQLAHIQSSLSHLQEQVIGLMQSLTYQNTN